MDPVECETGMNGNDNQVTREGDDGGADPGPDATPSLDCSARDPTGAAVDETTTTTAHGSTTITNPSDLDQPLCNAVMAATVAAPALDRDDDDALLAGLASTSGSTIVSAMTAAAPITEAIRDEHVDRDVLLATDTDHIHHDAPRVDDTDHAHHHGSALIDVDPVPAAPLHLIPPPPPTRVASHVSDSTAHTKSTLVRMAVPIPATCADAASPAPPPSRLVLIAVPPQMISIDKVMAAAAAVDLEDKAVNGTDEVKMTATKQPGAPMHVQDVYVGEIDASLATASTSDSLLAPAASFTGHDKGDDEPRAHHDCHQTVRAVPLRILFGLSDDDSSLDGGLHRHSDQEFPATHSWIRSCRHPDTAPINAPAAAMGVPGAPADTGYTTYDYSARLHSLMPSDEPIPASRCRRRRFWAEIADSLAHIEILFEDTKFQYRQLAALVAAKVYYHLGEFDDSVTFALGAGELFDLNAQSQFVETIIAKCIRQVVERMFQRCFDHEEYRQVRWLGRRAQF
ncbi:hypothetical protein AMAG_11367 [Allomyces macrogynus ATCC 38327]|uniref:26S proteasome non-ATPase regulatory subunit 1/RPN2 N-terminal domain-containing protein n=1 Tax=Allomyces macrogynus (strain ATCC 38327) TaxID=578462 RepID=A0A0L0SWL0_ALLM3|nr:hypothetical protein AMAG_11367 [Allomyces macrogynus ATCC 38327]|eukprot:KNE66892.1 hypothetical protein AMAG_11367 [Allomyces macrogynus ATCC 38327]